MKPKRIILIRHGESQGNVDWNIYYKIPDYAIYLTDKGIQQAKEVGQKIKDIIQWEDYCIYYSPYFRARQTKDEALKNLGSSFCSFQREEPRIREQEYSGRLRDGRHDDDSARDKYGKFFFRMHGGESGADVYDRVSDFIGTLNRDFEKENYPENCLIFAHGMTNRLFIMRWLHISIETFEKWRNPRNGEMYILELQNETNKYKLITEIAEHPEGYGYKYKI